MGRVEEQTVTPVHRDSLREGLRCKWVSQGIGYGMYVMSGVLYVSDVT